MGDIVELTAADGGIFSGYLASPAAARGPGVVVLQEIFGINDNIRTVCDLLAAAGYAAVAPDLFWRQEPGVVLEPAVESDRARATELMKGLDQQRAVEDVLAAAAMLRTAAGASGRIGVVGYCLGGKLAYLAAARPGIDAAVSYYGVAIQGSLDTASEIGCPLLLHIADEDHLCPPDAQAAIKAALTPLGAEILHYPGVGHAFARHNSPARDEPSAERADRATLDFLARRLG